MDEAFERLVTEAEQQPFSGWDFSYLRDRLHEGATSWDYIELVRRRLPAARALLDLGTGGGEILASLAPLPPGTMATEAYAPNVPIARERLAPLGIEVVAVEGAPDNVEIAPGAGLGSLPFADERFPLVLSRHESYYPAEVFRILERGGSFLTQQVGDSHNQGLNDALGVPPRPGPTWNLAFAARQLEGAGFRIVDRREEFPETVFTDIGAVTYYLKAIPWEIPGFTIAAHRDRLAALHRSMVVEGGLRIRGHLFYLEAVKRPAR
jgi:SAM-dependent methyltransferase